MLAIKSEIAPLLTAREVARQLGVSVAWVLQHASGARRPVIPSVKLGKSVRFLQNDISEFIARCRRCMEKGIPIQ
jgi:predicted DNA-binding transcriptional regulator AlpA